MERTADICRKSVKETENRYHGKNRGNFSSRPGTEYWNHSLCAKGGCILFSAGTRDQFQVVISFGRCSAEQFRMLGFHGELEENPTANYKSGQALVLVDGQEAIREITVPWILNEKELCQQIRYLLDRQPDLTALCRAAAEGRSTVK